MTPERAAAMVRRWFDAALMAVDPARAVAAHLANAETGISVSGKRIDIPGKVIVIAIGKAAVPMARAAERQLGERVAGGIALTKDGHAGGSPLARIAIREASHPIPDARGVAAANEILELVATASRDNFVLALISGGGSALFEAPVEGVSLADIAATTELLLRAGAPIQDLNAVRIPLSRVKGGGLRAAALATRFATLILSDVLGNDPAVIASGPTTASSASGARAMTVLERYGIASQVPPAVVAALEESRPKKVDVSRDAFVVVADNRTAVDATLAAARADGVRGRIAADAVEGEARALAVEWVDRASRSDDDLLLGGGEATVTVRGDGVGGRNTEFALAAALELERRGMSDWLVASLATDGQDANTGVAGAIGTAETIAHARSAGVDPEAALARNDSLAVFRAAGGIVDTGPTGTNVNDIYIAWRFR